MKEEKMIRSRRIYERDWMKIDCDTVECDGGVITTKEIIRHPGAAVILAIQNDNVLIEKQYRYAIRQFVYELPAGKLHENEEPLQGAIREFEEECGCHATTMEYLGDIYPTFAYSDEILHIFVVREWEKTETHFDEDESIEVQCIPLSEVIKMIKDNRIVDAKTICAIFKYLLIREKSDI